MKLYTLPFAEVPGQEQGPGKILDALKQFPLSEAGISHPFTHEELSNLENLRIGATGIILGGSHAITLPCFVSFLQHHPDSGIVIFDAHPDCAHEKDLLPGLLKKIPAEKILLIGVRNSKGKEREFLAAHKIRVFSLQKIMQEGLQDICDSVMETVREWPSFYLSLDLDVLDPSCAPGVEVAEPGGLSARELLYFVQRLRLLKNFRMADICELQPDKDVQGMTAKLAAKVVRELL